MLIGKVYSKRLKVFLWMRHTLSGHGELFVCLMMVICLIMVIDTKFQGTVIPKINVMLFGEIRSLLPAQAPILALTATITKSGRAEVSRTLGLHNEAIIAISPCKSIIKFLKMPFVSIEESFANMVGN